MLAINPTTLASAVKSIKSGIVNAQWIAAIDHAASQLANCKSVTALTDSKLRFDTGKGRAFTATCDVCENPACCQRRGACEHCMAAVVFARYREIERKQLPASEIVYNAQVQMNKDCTVTMTCEGRTITLTARQFATLCVFGEFGDVAESVGATELLLEAQIGYHADDE